jgi:hypothetical protein
MRVLLVEDQPEMVTGRNIVRRSKGTDVRHTGPSNPVIASAAKQSRNFP